jgi:uncharacterized membrane protein (UPF0127 family)
MKIFFLALFLFFSFQLKAQENILIKFENDTSFLAELLTSPEEKALGLSFRTQKDNFAVLFWYDAAQELIFWMKDMNFAIDILWIRENKVVWIEENVPPPSKLLKTSKLPTFGHNILADKVLELPAGSSKKHNIKKGDKVRMHKQ